MLTLIYLVIHFPPTSKTEFRRNTQMRDLKVENKITKARRKAGNTTITQLQAREFLFDVPSLTPLHQTPPHLSSLHAPICPSQHLLQP